MILAFDTHYREQQAKTVCICFENWTDDKPLHVYTAITADVADYEPGSFYKRELPCILNLFSSITLQQINYIVIDGFVTLDDHGKKGLGGYLYEALENKIPIIGVAKNNFHGNEKHVIPLYRGDSARPLYISAVGITKETAAQHIQSMTGAYRMPHLLKHLDTMTKEQ